MERLGGAGTFRLFGCVALGLCGVHVVARWALRRWCPEPAVKVDELTTGGGTDDALSVDRSDDDDGAHVGGQLVVAVQEKY